jgi:precorrin-6Y C5,15-methyltransferase (decarboxylating)
VGCGVNARASITVVGCDGALLSPAARAALDAATLVVGGARHLDALGLLDRRHGGSDGQSGECGQAPTKAVPATITLGPLGPAIDALAAHVGPATVLASGDPGFFGVLRALRDAGLEPVAVIPAVSSIAAAFARAGIPWDDALVVSAHGGGHGRDVRRAANVCRAHPKVALLTGPGAGAAQLARELLVGGVAPERVLVVAQRLSEHPSIINRPNRPLKTSDQDQNPTSEARARDDQERVEVVTLDQAAGRDSRDYRYRDGFAEPNVVLCLHPGLLADPSRDGSSSKRWLAGWTGLGGEWALGESAFDHRDGQITKAEVRAQIVARLAPSVGDLVWDLGAGSGSVGIECARFGAAVIAVEQDADSCRRIGANSAAHGVEVAVVRGRAPGVLAELPRPDAVFVGGGGLDVVRGALSHGPARVVVALTSVERVGEVVRSLEADGREVGGVLTQFSRLAALPDGTHRFAALNPVYLIWGSTA